MAADAQNDNAAADRVFIRQRKIRFADLGELFLARLLLNLVRDPLEERIVTVGLDLACLFPSQKLDDLVKRTSELEFTYSDRMTENMVDFMTNALGLEIAAKEITLTALDHYTEQIQSSLSYLRDGDGIVLPKLIQSFQMTKPGSFEVTFSTGHVLRTLGESIEKQLELVGQVVRKTQAQVPLVVPRVDYRKELDLLLAFLMDRQQLTGERHYSFSSREIPFRQAIWPSGKGAMPSPGTCGPAEKILLPIFLEANGLLDITHMGLISNPVEPLDIEIKYAINLPAEINLFGAAFHGLTAETRKRLNEVELSIYERLHRELTQRYVFSGRSKLEHVFADLASWTIRKVSYCLEEPSFLSKRANEWFSDRRAESPVRMEDEFFLPFLQERLRESFGSRIRKKTESYGGRADLYLDEIPIELKVQRGRRKSLSQFISDEYKPAAQASAYASGTRIGFVLVLDLPDGEATTTNLDSCFHVIERSESSDFPTCVVVAIFHCHHLTPSRIG